MHKKNEKPTDEDFDDFYERTQHFEPDYSNFNYEGLVFTAYALLAWVFVFIIVAIGVAIYVVFW